MGTITKRGADLKVGDTIKVWWRPNADTIIELTPYSGPLAHLFPAGAQIAKFAVYAVGMTIDNNDDYEVVQSIAAPRGERRN